MFIDRKAIAGAIAIALLMCVASRSLAAAADGAGSASADPGTLALVINVVHKEPSAVEDSIAQGILDGQAANVSLVAWNDRRLGKGKENENRADFFSSGFARISSKQRIYNRCPFRMRTRRRQI